MSNNCVNQFMRRPDSVACLPPPVVSRQVTRGPAVDPELRDAAGPLRVHVHLCR